MKRDREFLEMAELNIAWDDGLMPQGETKSYEKTKNAPGDTWHLGDWRTPGWNSDYDKGIELLQMYEINSLKRVAEKGPDLNK